MSEVESLPPGCEDSWPFGGCSDSVLSALYRSEKTSAEVSQPQITLIGDTGNLNPAAAVKGSALLNYQGKNSQYTDVNT